MNSEEIKQCQELRTEGMSISEIAKKTGIPRGTVQLRLNQYKAATPPLPPSESDKNKINWEKVIYLIVFSIPVSVFTPWLIYTAGSVFIKEMGLWGWFIGCGLEFFIVGLALFVPKCNKRTDGLKVIFWYAMLINVAFINYQTINMPIIQKKSEAVIETTNQKSSEKEVEYLQKQREVLLELLKEYTEKSWLTAARKVKDDILNINSKIEVMVKTNGVPKTTVMEYFQVNSWLRLLILVVNIVCLHLIINKIRE